MPASVILIAWVSGDWPGQWTGIAYAPYSIIVCALIGTAIGVNVQRRTLTDRSAGVGLILAFAMAGAGMGTGTVFAIFFPVPILAGFIGANLGFIFGAVFGSLFVVVARPTGATMEAHTSHCVCLRLLASAVPAAVLIALYLGIHVHQGAAPALSVAEDYVIVPLILAALAALPVWFFGPATRRHFPSERSLT
ncbi:MAG: hypothetical protein WBW04_19590 [Nitrolancea sp.]